MNDFTHKGFGGGAALLLNNNGIGDDVHALPAVQQFIVENPGTTLYVNRFTADLFGRLEGDYTIHPHGELFGYMGELRKRYAIIYDLGKWCISVANEWKHLTRFEQMAKILGVELPEIFLQYAISENAHYDTPEILLALDSNEIYRTYTRKHALLESLQRACGNDAIITCIGRRSGEYWADNFSDLANRISRANLFIGVDSGPLAIACAMGTPTVALMGPTDADKIVHQFDRYNAGKRVAIRAAPHTLKNCVAPCEFQGVNGFKANGQCLQYSECMQRIEMPSHVIEMILEMIQ